MKSLAASLAAWKHGDLPSSFVGVMPPVASQKLERREKRLGKWDADYQNCELVQIGPELQVAYCIGSYRRWIA